MCYVYISLKYVDCTNRGYKAGEASNGIADSSVYYLLFTMVSIVILALAFLAGNNSLKNWPDL